MSKRARRLWLGDWQRGQGPDQLDTIRILPDDEPEPDPAAEAAAARRRSNTRRAVVGGLAIGVLCAFILTLTSGGDDTQRTAASTPPPAEQLPQVVPQPQQVPPQGGGGFGAPDLTGAAADKAAKAALAKFPGDIERVTAGPGGGYVVHVIQGDGNEVHVFLSDRFKVLGSDAGRLPPGGFAPGGSANSS
jgi:hypothetical protein